MKVLSHVATVVLLVLAVSAAMLVPGDGAAFSDKPPRDSFPPLGTKTVLVASTDLSDHEVYAIADKLSHNIHDIIKDIPFNATKVADSDPTIRERFNTYRFADHKDKVIDLVGRVTRVSVATMEIVAAMDVAGQSR